MSYEEPTVVAARWLLPIRSAPINGGWIRLQGEKILELGAGRPPSGAHDLGDVALMPRLVNAHTHLEFSDCIEPIGEPGVPLYQWIGEVIAARGKAEESQRQNAIELGVEELRRSGTIVAGEISTPPCRYPEAAGNDLNSFPQITRFAEVVGLDPQRGQERLSAAATMIEQDGLAAISPHAPYSTPIELIRQCVELARVHNRPLAMHVAESPAERELLSNGSGPFATSLQSIGVWRDGLFPWGDDPMVDLIELLARAPRSLLIHGNDLQVREIDQIAKHPNLSVVFCPRTHHFFRYDTHPVAQLQAAGVNVALGTDSRASNPDLNLWSEVQFLLQNRSDLDPSSVLAMATLHGAIALGRDDVGQLATGCVSSLGVVPSEAATIDQLYVDLAANAYAPVDSSLR